MITVPCYGVQPDEVGLRYLVQKTGVTHNHSFSQTPKFKVVSPKYNYPCPHRYKLRDWGCPEEDELVKFLSPIPSETKGYVYEGDPTELTRMAKFSGANIMAGWMLDSRVNERITLASNIGLTIVMGVQPRNSEMIDELQSALQFGHGKVIFQGNYYFSSQFERIGAPIKTEEPEKVGASNLFKYLKERD